MKILVDGNEIAESNVTDVMIDRDSQFPRVLVELGGDKKVVFDLDKNEYKLLGGRVLDLLADPADQDLSFYLTLAKKKLIEKNIQNPQKKRYERVYFCYYCSS